MNRLPMITLMSLMIVSSLFAASKPPIPSPEPSYTDPGTPELRRAYKIAVLENEISQDKYIIANPGTGKGKEVSERVATAKHNLKINQEVLEKIKGGADMEVYFCSLCGRELMENTNCPHCKMMKDQKTVPLFEKGIKRPSAIIEKS